MNRQVEANLSMVVSKALGGLNMNALKYLLPLWIAPVTGAVSYTHLTLPTICIV